MNGVELIAAERERQISQKGWTSEHDDTHNSAQLAWAAVCYAAPSDVFVERRGPLSIAMVDPWPFPAVSDLSGRGAYDDDARKRDGRGSVMMGCKAPMPKEGPERVRFLVKAGALIAAEIDRLSRAGK